MTTTEDGITAPDNDVRDVLKEYGWTCGPEFEQRYLTDAWVFNLVNIIEKQAVVIENLRQDLEDAGSALSQAEGAARAYQADLRDARAEARYR